MQGVISDVPVPVPPSERRVKYRLVFIVNGHRLVEYDNERGKKAGLYLQRRDGIRHSDMPTAGDRSMDSMDVSPRKKGIRMVGAAIGLMMAPVLAMAQTVATITSSPSATPQPGPDVHFYYGPGMMGGWGPGYYGSDMMGGFGLFWGLLCLLVIVGIVLGIALLIRGAFTFRHRMEHRTGGMSDHGSAAALNLLDEHYARGEIERDEYLEKRSDLGK
ncbi:hypothetical protein [Acidithiobacillus sp.]|uniref:SHOCT domain-containing protein n=1 Tax=Acidithiobacillus sp. TaxID=1872118 RepID=UPI0026105FEE|nr:hypothetical protein [Acidithiobacillus sp.]